MGRPPIDLSTADIFFLEEPIVEQALVSRLVQLIVPFSRAEEFFEREIVMRCDSALLIPDGQGQAVEPVGDEIEDSEFGLSNPPEGGLRGQVD